MYVAISTELTAAFGSTYTVTAIRPPPSGANSGSHRIVDTAEGSTFSLKCSIRMPGTDGDKSEYVSHQLAERIGLRGSSTARKIAPIAGLDGELGRRPANAIRWASPDALQISACQASISSASGEFLEQLGYWAVFTTMVGVTNRSTENVVWHPTTLTLAHVDFEDAFRQKGGLTEQLQFARTYGGLDPDSWRANVSYAPGLRIARGVTAGSDLLVANRDGILSFMRSEGISSPAVEYAAEWIDLSADQKVVLARQSAG